MADTIQLSINGTPYTVPAAPERPLLWVLRDELGLTGTRFGCGVGICGACTVHLDGKAARACQTVLSAVGAQTVRTIEGLAEPDGTLHPVQQAFIDEQVPQCGWCMSGQIMSAAAFLETSPTPTADEIAVAMSGNYCRCGCYVRIKRAVSRAAEVQG